MSAPRLELVRRFTLAAVGTLLTLPVSAVLFLGTDNPKHNTTPPDGALADSGWQWEGDWLSFLGTAIGPHHFLTARHVAGAVGGEFLFRGQRYRTSAVYDDPTGTDLRIWRVCDTLPDWAPLYERLDEIGQPFVVIGRGTRRGSEVYMTGVDGTTEELRGWRWGTPDGVRRWGTNVIARLIKNDFGSELLTATFDRDGGFDEATLSGGDSGGAIFIRDGASWKMAGICSFVDGGFSYTNGPPDFNAALYDAGGFYIEDKKVWVLLPDTPEDLMSELYVSRVSSRLAWIREVLEMPVEETPVLLASSNPAGPYEPAANATIIQEGGAFAVPVADEPQFFRLRAACPATITSIRIERDLAVIAFQ